MYVKDERLYTAAGTVLVAGGIATLAAVAALPAAAAAAAVWRGTRSPGWSAAAAGAGFAAVGAAASVALNHTWVRQNTRSDGA